MKTGWDRVVRNEGVATVIRLLLIPIDWKAARHAPAKANRDLPCDSDAPAIECTRGPYYEQQAAGGN